MVGKTKDSHSSNGMTEELLTSRFGSHESVCKPDQPDLGQVMAGRQAESSKVDQLRRNIYKVGSSLWFPVFLLYPVFVIILDFNLNVNAASASGALLARTTFV